MSDVNEWMPFSANGFPNDGQGTLYKMNLIGHPGSPSSEIFLFNDDAHDYLWSMDNVGLRNAEVRFMELPQNIGLDP